MIFFIYNYFLMNKKVITITWPHWSWKDTLISNAINLIGNTKKVVSSTDRLPRPWEIPGYSYYYEANKPSETEIFDWITVPSINNRTGIVWVNYWITKSLVDSLFFKRWYSISTTHSPNSYWKIKGRLLTYDPVYLPRNRSGITCRKTNETWLN